MGFFISISPNSFTVCALSTAKQFRPWHNADHAQKPKCSFADHAEGKEAGRQGPRGWRGQVPGINKSLQFLGQWICASKCLNWQLQWRCLYQSTGRPSWLWSEAEPCNCQTWREDLPQTAKPRLAWQAEKAENLSSGHLPWPLCNTPNIDTWWISITT